MRSVGVFCGSSAGVRPEYAAAAAELGRQIAGRGMSLVYGGARVGLMGVVADAALCVGGRVTGVLPAHLRDREIAHLGLTDLRVVGSMHERKALMAELSDGFVALPGGFGTLDELAEVLTWSQLGLHAKPCGLLDVAAFWRPLLTFVDHAVGEGFVRAEHRRLLVDADEPAALLDRMAAWRAPAVEKWVTPAGAPVAGASVAAPPIDGPLAGGPPGAVPPVGGPPGAVPPVGGPPGSAPPRPPSLHG